MSHLTSPATALAETPHGLLPRDTGRRATSPESAADCDQVGRRNLGPVAQRLAELKQEDVMAAAKTRRLVDNKVASFSDELSALKLVIPLAARK